MSVPTGIRLGAAAAILLLCWSGESAGLGQSAAPAQDTLQQAVINGSAALQKGDYAGAERAFREALALDPESVPILNDLAICVVRQQRDQEAIALYERALRLKPDDSITHRNLGVAYFRAREYKLALPLLQAFAKETSSFQALNLTGLDLFALDRYSEAAQYLDAAHKLEPRDLETLDMLGKAYLRAKNYPAVTGVFSQIMAINPDAAEAHVMMAMADDKLYRADAAIKEFEAALAADPHYPGIHTGLGIIYWRNDNIDEAEREFREELSRYPKDPIANCTLGRILRGGRNKPAEAIPYLEAALAVNPSYRDALLEMGEARISLEQPAAAIEPLQKAIALDPNDAQAHYILGTALNKSGRPAEGAKQRTICAQLRARERGQNNTGGEASR
jgi:tetratricopeptide (TPR) repeat protein